MSFVEMNISAGILVLLIILARKKFLMKLPIWTTAILWIMVALRLIFPHNIMAHFSILNLWNRLGVKLSDGILFLFGFRIKDEFRAIMDLYFTEAILHYIWLAGLILFSLYYLVSYIETCQKIRSSEILSHPYVDKEIKNQNLHRRITTKISDNIGSPSSFGLLRPVILFPKDFDFNDLKLTKMVIVHESIHIKYFHFVLKILVIIATCIFWFNPIMWLIKKYFDRDCEVFCDSRVIKKLGAEMRESYSISLIKMAEKKPDNYALCSAYNLGPIEERIKFIMNKKKVTISSVLASLLILTGTIGVFAASPTYLTNFDGLEVIVEEVNEPETYLHLTEEEIAPYIVDSGVEERSSIAKSIDVSNYEYRTSGSLPTTIKVTINRNGYDYTGTLNRVRVELVGDNEMIGYYSGTLYR